MGREKRALFSLHALCESRLTSDDSRGLSQVVSLIPFPKPSPYFTKKSFWLSSQEPQTVRDTGGGWVHGQTRVVVCFRF